MPLVILCRRPGSPQGHGDDRQQLQLQRCHGSDSSPSYLSGDSLTATDIPEERETEDGGEGLEVINVPSANGGLRECCILNELAMS